MELKTCTRNRLIKYIAILIISIFPFYGCSSSPRQHYKSGLNSTFMAQMDLPFNEYIMQTERMISKARADIDDNNFEKVVEAVAPFELLPGKECGEQTPGLFKKGILLIHGFSDSPYLVKSLAKYYQSRCFLVRAILLPGHGTVPADLINVSNIEWLRATEYGVFRLRNRVENMYIGGYSTGAILALYSALKHKGEFRGLFIFSPAIKINSVFTPLAEKVSFYKKWLITNEDLDYAKYESITMNGVAQVHGLIKKLERQLETGTDLDVPVFMALTMDDTTVNAKSAIRFFSDHVISSQSRGYVYVNSPEKYKFNDSRITAVNSYFPKEHIADMSHLSITIAPNDPHYGKNGDYANCLHYREDIQKQKACKKGGPNIWRGETTVMNKYKYVLRRLTYNPNFDQLTSSMDKFLMDAGKK